MSNNVIIPYKQIITLIEDQFQVIKSENTDFKNISFIVSDEQMFNKIKDKKRDTLYIVLRFGAASFNYGQATLPLEMAVLGFDNEVEKTQAFLNAFVGKYNLSQSGSMTQLYMTPRVSLNFNEVYNTFRSLFSVTGTFVIGDNTIRMSAINFYINGGEDPNEVPELIKVLSYNDSTTNSLNPQPYSDEKGRVRSYGSFQTFAFSVLIYPDGSKKLVQKLMKMKFGPEENHQNDTFCFSLTFDNLDLDFDNSAEHTPVNTTSIWKYKCRNADFNQKIGEIPAISITFSL